MYIMYNIAYRVVNTSIFTAKVISKSCLQETYLQSHSTVRSFRHLYEDAVKSNVKNLFSLSINLYYLN